MQARDYPGLTVIWGRSPRRARKTIELPGENWLGEEQPQWESRCQLNLRGWNLLRRKIAAVTPTMPNETNCCQFTLSTYLVSPAAQLLFYGDSSLDMPPHTINLPTDMGLTPFQYRHRVTYAECTAGNHIYYSRYLDLLEAARGEFFRHLGAPFLQWQERQIILPVIECRLRYQAPAHYDDLLTIELWPAALERVRLTFASRILNQSGVVILLAETTHACTGTDEKPRRIPEELEKLLRPWVPGSTPSA